MTRAAKDADVVVMAAAVADFRPKDYAAAKIKKTHAATADGSPDESAPTIELVRNPDILAGLVEARGAAERPLIVGFAAETGDATGSVMDLPAPSWRARAATCSSPTRWASTRPSAPTATPSTCSSADGLPGAPADRVAGPAPKAEIAAAVWDGVQAVLDPG